MPHALSYVKSIPLLADETSFYPVGLSSAFGAWNGFAHLQNRSSTPILSQGLLTKNV